MKTAVERFLEAPSPSKLRKQDFLLSLESQMLFPELKNEHVALEYETFLTMKANPAKMPTNPAPTGNPEPEPEPKPRGAMASYSSRLKPEAVASESDGEFDAHHPPVSWAEPGDTIRRLAPPPPPLPPPPPELIKLDLEELRKLVPYRKALNLANAFSKASNVRAIIDERTIDGQVAGVCLDILRLLANTDLKTSKGRLATQSINIAAYVCAEHNLGRPRRTRGRPPLGEYRYPDLDEQRVKKIWRNFRDSSVLWSAYKTLTKNRFHPMVGNSLLSGLGIHEFTKLTGALNSSNARFSDLGTAGAMKEALDSELLQALLEHVPRYSAN
ncbi:hypothetical protein SAMN05216344_10958 [Polaromonas sp. OV174]|uniref:hypothetical protein n=1 Tax=Polaromonas sp. OV174 TaxID=1855300 RepID=UPI0008EAC8F3|nr:hypothetical protein [Polaromonas sp. OV174]SFC11016.1 hypothetical protein SAMN05216344_10958 [Polaromonas sp. OV174]